MRNFLFEITSEWSDLCGEQFFIQCDTLDEADEVLGEYFWGEKVTYLGEFTDEEAEAMGYDTY